MTDPQLGASYTFMPAGLTDFKEDRTRNGLELPRRVTGRIVHISRRRRHFTVAYELNGVRLMESFKF